MILYINEERTYLHWVTHHRNGFVLDAHYKAAYPRPVIHRATCPEIRSSKTKHTHWTTGSHCKACALAFAELQQWALDAWQANAECCGQCQPNQVDQTAAATGDLTNVHLTRLGRDILSYVLDVAVFHLDEGDSDYHLTVGNLARCLNKSPGQLAEPLARLVRDGFIKTTNPIITGEPPRGRTVVYPTIGALRTVPFYAESSEADLAAELEKLRC